MFFKKSSFTCFSENSPEGASGHTSIAHAYKCNVTIQVFCKNNFALALGKTRFSRKIQT